MLTPSSLRRFNDTARTLDGFIVDVQDLASRFSIHSSSLLGGNLIVAMDRAKDAVNKIDRILQASHGTEQAFLVEDIGDDLEDLQRYMMEEFQASQRFRDLQILQADHDQRERNRMSKGGEHLYDDDEEDNINNENTFNTGGGSLVANTGGNHEHQHVNDNSGQGQVGGTELDPDHTANMLLDAHAQARPDLMNVGVPPQPSSLETHQNQGGLRRTNHQTEKVQTPEEALQAIAESFNMSRSVVDATRDLLKASPGGFAQILKMTGEEIQELTSMKDTGTKRGALTDVEPSKGQQDPAPEVEAQPEDDQMENSRTQFNESEEDNQRDEPKTILDGFKGHGPGYVKKMTVSSNWAHTWANFAVGQPMEVRFGGYKGWLEDYLNQSRLNELASLMASENMEKGLEANRYKDVLKRNKKKQRDAIHDLRNKTLSFTTLEKMGQGNWPVWIAVNYGPHYYDLNMKGRERVYNTDEHAIAYLKSIVKDVAVAAKKSESKISKAFTDATPLLAMYRHTLSALNAALVLGPRGETEAQLLQGGRGKRARRNDPDDD